MSDSIICWFSNGSASACATKLTLESKPSIPVKIVSCDTRPSEHQDNYRFSKQCEEWFGQPIIFIRNSKYDTVDDVIERTRYMSGVLGARCTTELKKIPRLEFAAPDDIHVFGYTWEERGKRRRDFEQRNPELILKWTLIENHFTKRNCHEMIADAGIVQPVMYQLGFDNNNCPGCLKASSPWYWSMVRKHFPAVFQKRCEQSREIGCKLVEISHHNRIFLDELPDREFKKRKKENLSCGPECGQSLLKFK
jgi:3'-phosphoadenosine 5'-phosphosulfate sulfotransferase (PAPS reductase)/FAD synthetase